MHAQPANPLVRVQQVFTFHDVRSGCIIGTAILPWEGDLSWSPTSSKVVCATRIRDGGRACVSDMDPSQWHDVPINIKPHPIMRQGWGWMPDGHLIIAHGSYTGQAGGEQPDPAFHLILLDGTIAYTWQTQYPLRPWIDHPPTGASLVQWHSRISAISPSWLALRPQPNA